MYSHLHGGSTAPSLNPIWGSKLEQGPLPSPGVPVITSRSPGPLHHPAELGVPPLSSARLPADRPPAAKRVPHKGLTPGLPFWWQLQSPPLNFLGCLPPTSKDSSICPWLLQSSRCRGGSRAGQAPYSGALQGLAPLASGGEVRPMMLRGQHVPGCGGPPLGKVLHKPGEAAVTPAFVLVPQVPLPVSPATSEPSMSFWRDADS